MKPDNPHQIPNALPISNKRVLLAALNWGFGHVSRSIGLINQLQNKGCEVVVAGSNSQLHVFKQYFPDLVYEFLEDYPFIFSGKGNFANDLLRSRRGLKRAFHNDSQKVVELCNHHHIDVVISDHRYGFFHPSVKSIFLCHQVRLPVPAWQFFANWYHKKLIKNFHELWVPDFDDCRLSGKLGGANMNLPKYFIGPLSRFDRADEREKNIDKLILVSGPEPYAFQFFHNWMYLLGEGGQKVKIVYGNYSGAANEDIIHSNNWREIDELIKSSKQIITRSGYSSILDAQYVDAQFQFYPTPGQREQIYLANRHEKTRSVS